MQTGNVLRGAARRSDARFRRPEPGDRGVLDHDFADGDGDDFLPVRDDPAPDPAAGHAHNHRQSGLGLLGRADSDQLRGGGRLLPANAGQRGRERTVQGFRRNDAAVCGARGSDQAGQVVHNADFRADVEQTAGKGGGVLQAGGQDARRVGHDVPEH